jgi:hypothetical protein
MQWFLYLFSVLWIALGACLILYTQQTRERMAGLIGTGRDKFVALVPALIGLLLILSASSSRNSWFIVLIGIVGLAKGAMIFTNFMGLWEQTRQWYLETARDQTYRLSGIVALVLGTAVFSWVR